MPDSLPPADRCRCGDLLFTLRRRLGCCFTHLGILCICGIKFARTLAAHGLPPSPTKRVHLLRRSIDGDQADQRNDMAMRSTAIPAAHGCASGWQRVCAACWGSAPHYDEDHLVPLERGSAPADPSNLWPESPET